MGTAENESGQKPESGGRERRVYPRSQCWGSAGIKILPDGVWVMGYLIDLGLGGCHIDADSVIPVEIGSRVEALLKLNGFSLRLAGVVAHMEENNLRAGIEFADVSARKEEQIERLMAAILQADKERAKGVEELGG